ncbi:hypothetical protein [Nocardioides sp. Root140]|uniref:hypothetical protein n=1 Tax=Nocardioides sp. Root140 TaxID=1736460 RepID=UPI0006FE12AB|nr:hypothetical protein [Nocardioides sp. Root140]KQY51562.1 hypothetical protein ASD30_19510 [Nocardioides sp. Root140]
MSEHESVALEVVTPQGLLDRRERVWAEQLSTVSLAAEYPVDDEFREQALECLGLLYRRGTDSRARARVLRRWPAVHVLSTTGVATDHYVAGTFWPSLTKLIATSLDQTVTKEWGEAFLENLSTLDLPTFDASDDAGTKYVGRILMHSGMPTLCLADLYRLISERRNKIAGLSAADFVAWVTVRAAHKQLHNVAKPVARFLQYGNEFAVDVTDRAFDLLDAIAAGGDGTDVPLPDRFRKVAIELNAQGEIHPVSRRSSRSGGDADQQPRLVIDPFGQGLMLRLPAVGDAPDGSATWIVGLDASSQRVATRALAPGLNEPAPQTDVALLVPTRIATVAMAGREDLTVTLTIVDETDPLLAFGEDGVRLAAGLPLPSRPTWLLFPGDPATLEAKGGAVLSESPLPPGWSGWCLLLVDLEKCVSVRVLHDDYTYRAHGVRKYATARVVADDPLRGMRTSTGLPVISSLPTVHLPEELGEANWQVTLLDGSGELVARWVSGGDNDDPNSIWGAVPRPVVGAFTVRVRGPWGRGTSRALKIIEGLQASFNPPWRRFVTRGLQPCKVKVSVADGIDTPRTELDFDERELEHYLRVGAHGDYTTLVITPPHMSIAYQSTSATTAPSIKPLRLFREDIVEDPGTLVLDIGESASPVLRVIVTAGVIQDVEPGAGRNGVYQFNLAKIVDTLAVYPQAKLSLDADSQLVVGHIRPQSLFSGVELVDDALEFVDCVDVEGLTALMYTVRAPWREPTSLQVVNARTELPEHLRGAGPLRVVLRIEDPWVPEPVPAWPAIGRSVLVEADGHPCDGEAEETLLSAYLAGEGELPAGDLDFTRLWTIRGLIGGLALEERAGDVVRAIDDAVFADPRPALNALTASGVPDRSIPALIVRTGLAWAELAAAHDDEPPTWTGRGALPAALISAADLHWSEDEVLAAVDICGTVATDMAAGRDPEAKAGRLDDSADLFDKMPGLRDSFVRQAGLVPSGLLSGDARVIAAMEFIKHRHDPDISFIVRNAHKLLDESVRMLRILDDTRATAAFEARRHPTREGGWRVVPEISLALALAARHAARGHEVARNWMNAKQRVWGDLAKVVPQLVTTDLLIAELLVASSSAPAEETPA